MRALRYRVVEAKVFRTGEGFRVEAYLLIQGQGKPIRFHIATVGELPGALNAAIETAYLDVTGEPLLNTAR